MFATLVNAGLILAGAALAVLAVRALTTGRRRSGKKD